MKKDKVKMTYQELQRSGYLGGASSAYVDALYEDYLRDQQSVPTSWQEFFASLSIDQPQADVSHAGLKALFAAAAQQTAVPMAVPVSDKQHCVDSLISAFRRFGHYAAKINPLHQPQQDARLAISSHQLADADKAQTFLTRGVLAEQTASLAEIEQALQQRYCGSIGFEFFHIDDDNQREWLQDHIERQIPQVQFTNSMKQSLLSKLTEAEGLEKFLDVKYPGQKRFSLEGLDSLIPLLDELGKSARANGVKELKIGMAHRGRINVLVNIMGQSSAQLFQEFDGTFDFGNTTGDVKYHRGFSSDVATPTGPLHLTLSFNPSHLEFINPVVMGSVRARQDNSEVENKKDYAMAVMIHGDAAFAAQGVVMESLSMSHTHAYDVGGSIHIITNNQVGFTTSDPLDARSSHYCTDIAKMIAAPIIHVNADDPEAVIHAVRLAVDYRMHFHHDVVIDLVGFRRHGHQEVDEPRATQPLMYRIIKQHPGARTLYANQLVQDKVIDQVEVDKLWTQFRDLLDCGKQTIETLPEGLSQYYATNWTPYLNRTWHAQVDTSVKPENLELLGQAITKIPEGMVLQRNVGAIMAARSKMVSGEQNLDWGCAETLAYAALISEGVEVRLSGEDAQRGTFFHRQAVLHDQNTGECYMPLAHLENAKANIDIYNSLLSETGALGFEYGFSLADPRALVIWEAQFGDFANGAQVIIDQFISSGWQKWTRLSGLVMLLPHGYEGMGPEHSSARLERFMQLCAQDNIQVCVPTTPAQIFHLLRRQVLRPYRKPLVVMSPKSLLRHKLAVSSLDELTQGHFQNVIDEVDDMPKEQVKRVVVCSGKVYYDLLERRRAEEISNIAIVRIEQLYPFPYDEFESVLEPYSNAEELLWCQEEPKNQGAWFITRRRLMKSKLDQMRLLLSSRPASAAPAAGYKSMHVQQQRELVEVALGIENKESDPEVQ